MPGAYQGIKVLDFSMFLAGPYCTRLMADMGADVIKVEPPAGDFLRAAPPLRDGHSAYFGHLNCGKRSICVDLKQPESATVVRRLAERADVLIENFRPGVMSRLGLAYDDVRAANPNIIYCSVTGYGQTGPNADRPSFAPIIHAASGFDLLTPRYAPEVERPLTNRNAMADYLAATHALAGIGAALFHRANTGQGNRLDIALMDTMHHAMSYEYVDAQFPGQAPPTFRPLPTSDGFVAIAPVSEGNFRGLVEAAGHPEWMEDERFRSREARVQNWSAIFDAVEGWTRTVSSREAEHALLAAGCPASAYRTIGESQKDPHVSVRGSAAQISDGAGSFQVANCPIQFTETPAGAIDAVPTLGGDTRTVLTEAGYPSEEISTLYANRVVS